jgi:hypothetical protein
MATSPPQPPPPPTNYLRAPVPHNFGPKCRLAPVVRPFTPAEGEAIPPVKAQFFYASPIPIDDPLSTATIAGSSDSKSANIKPQPFSEGDNNALEKGWLGLASDDYRRNHSQARRNRSPSPSLAKANLEKLRGIVQDLAIQHKEKHAREGPGHEVPMVSTDSMGDADAALPLCCPDVLLDVAVQLRTSFCAVARRRQRALNQDRVVQEVMAEMEVLKTDASATVTEGQNGSGTVTGNPPKDGSVAINIVQPGSWESESRPSNRKDPERIPSRQASRARSRSILTARSSLSEINSAIAVSVRPSGLDDGISGRPFVRVGTPESTQFPMGSLPRSVADVKPAEEKPAAPERQPARPPAVTMPSTLPERRRERPRNDTANIPVGVSRLHEVSLPALQMKPIYWSPVNDIAAVLRATWFYKYVSHQRTGWIG